MKYLIKYLPFFEGAIPKGKSKVVTDAQGLQGYLNHSPAMQDILALVSKGRIRGTEEKPATPMHWRKRVTTAKGAEYEEERTKEPMSYKLKKNGDIYFDKTASYRYFGQEAYLIKQENYTFTLKVEENSKLTFEKNYENIEDALRNVWAFFVSRTKEYTVSTKYIKEVTRKLLIDPAKKPFWGEKKTAVEIIQELGVKQFGAQEEGQEPKVDMANVLHLLNETYSILGMPFKSAGGNDIIMPTKFGITNGQDNLLSLMLKGLFNVTKIGESGGTYEPSYKEKEVRIIRPVTEFHDDKGSAGIYYIQPRTTEEAYIQCLVKVCKVYYKHYGPGRGNFNYEKLYFNGKSMPDNLIRNFIYKYSSILVNEVSKKGLEALNEEDIFYKTIFAALTNNATGDTYVLSNIIQKSAPEFWDKIKSYDSAGMEVAADMGDMGFGD